MNKTKLFFTLIVFTILSGFSIFGQTVTNSTDGGIFLKGGGSQYNNWLFQENGINWGLFYLNHPENPKYFGNYLTKGAETFFTRNEEGGWNFPSTAVKLDGIGTNQYTYAVAMLSHVNGYFWTAGTIETMSNLLVNGNIGIGTKDPQSKLHFFNSVLGDVTMAIRLDGLTNTERAIGFYDNGNLAWWFGRDNTGVMQNGLGFWKSGSTGWVLTMADNGNVGIGTDNPTHKLSVNGTIKAKEIIVELTGWSDFVFDKDYKLKSLTEVENFIKDNGHLPSIPSEKEVLEQGISVGEINSKLLQKIEELTLYMIEIKKENQKLTQEVEKLKDMVK